jgi:UDP-N-acetylglucosamine--N-acetylmuramyl-(pentapeptide) pyrophosphoryl-undecaprenol N-acetylglucosamine transferase
MHVVLTGGGTLGPVTPLIAVSRALKALAPGADVSWIGTKGGPEERIVREAGIPFSAISAGKLRRYFSWRNLVDPLLVVQGFFEARRALKAAKASVVVSAGGFVAVPVAWAARSLGIPVHVHQQDVRPGLANRLSLPAAASMSVALESSVADFPGRHPEWTGNPVRPELAAGSREEAKRIFGLEDGVPVVLVLGGGTGAAGLNRLVRDALPSLTERVQLIHVAGPGKTDPSVVSPRYRQVELLTSELPHAFAAASLVVTRAGMGVLSELSALGKPAIIVPMPGSHQEDNAAAFARASGASSLDERETSPRELAGAILRFIDDPDRQAAVADGMRKANQPDAADRIARIIIRTAGLRQG